MDIFKKAMYKMNSGKTVSGAMTVIIAAAGSGNRMGGVSKPLMSLCGKRVIEYSLSAFSEVQSVCAIYISAKKEDMPLYEEILQSGAYPKLTSVVEGGSTRGESVKKAFEAAFCNSKTDFVAVHDAARPLITAAEINGAIRTAALYGSGVCASRVRDTVKRTGKGVCVTEDISRDGLWLISTPQVFDTDLYHTALSVAQRDAFEATDDSTLLSHAGFKIMLSEASSQNIKLTYPEDIALAEAILAARKESKFEKDGETK